MPMFYVAFGRGGKGKINIHLVMCVVLEEE